jgi:hypothetical protein
MSKVFIHLGLQKTASTYLQEKVFPFLSNIYYIGRPYTTINHAFNKLQYADEVLYKKEELMQEVKEIKEQAGNRDILISDELFSGYAFHNIINRGMIARRLAEIFPEAEIILFFRNQEELILSLYNQYVKIGLFSGRLDECFLQVPGQGFPLSDWSKDKPGHSLSDAFIRHHTSHEKIRRHTVFNVEHFRYSKIYEFYNEIFPKVHIFLYEDFKKDAGLELRRLGEILNTQVPVPKDVKKEKIVNKALDKQSLKKQLLKNRMGVFCPKLQRSKLGSVLAASCMPFFKISEEAHATYVRKVLEEANIFKDNFELDESLDLGMKNYADQYFREMKK